MGDDKQNVTASWDLPADNFTPTGMPAAGNTTANSSPSQTTTANPTSLDKDKIDDKKGGFELAKEESPFGHFSINDVKEETPPSTIIDPTMKDQDGHNMADDYSGLGASSGLDLNDPSDEKDDDSFGQDGIGTSYKAIDTGLGLGANDTQAETKKYNSIISDSLKDEGNANDLPGIVKTDTEVAKKSSFSLGDNKPFAKSSFGGSTKSVSETKDKLADALESIKEEISALEEKSQKLSKIIEDFQKLEKEEDSLITQASSILD
ncbi:MAG: hypothetical protein WC107_04400 [Patescibacteria group bacterium]